MLINLTLNQSATIFAELCISYDSEVSPQINIQGL